MENNESQNAQNYTSFNKLKDSFIMRKLFSAFSQKSKFLREKKQNKKKKHTQKKTHKIQETQKAR